MYAQLLLEYSCCLLHGHFTPCILLHDYCTNFKAFVIPFLTAYASDLLMVDVIVVSTNAYRSGIEVNYNANIHEMSCSPKLLFVTTGYGT